MLKTPDTKHVAPWQQPTLVDMSVTALKGVGPKVAERLTRLGIYSVQDVLFHFPFRYQDRTRIIPIGRLHHGNQAVIEGVVQLTEVKFGKRRTLLSRISDGTGSLTLRFFHFNALQKESLARGIHVRCFGEVRRGTATLEMIHPEYQVIDESETGNTEQCLTPIYPSTEGVHQLSLRAITDQALIHEQLLVDLLPEEVIAQTRMHSLADAISYVHRPPPDAKVEQLEAGIHPAQQRLALEELLAHHLSLRQLRENIQHQPGYVCDVPGKLMAQLLNSLPFELTSAQHRVIAEIVQDIKQNRPMQRLMQGDVGCGKTIVAACAVVHAVEAGYQAAVMAPTELLAEQHVKNFQAWLAPSGINVAWLSGKHKGRIRAAILDEIASGKAQVVIGTHALFQQDVHFAGLGLVVIDEQHRFGVHQRLALREKGSNDGRYPHQLIMTATPIPRTLAMVAYADLVSSCIDELPPGRKPVSTVVIPDSRRNEVVQRVHTACKQGHQVYWVCALIEESEVLQCQTAEDTAARLTEALPELRVGLVHGRMKPTEKEKVMQTFKAGDIDLLVATTVIEVGVDVPNASLMIIENAERMGLAQLHQLRGRVGRGSASSSCVLMYKSPLSQNAKTRLATMRETNDGFEIARQDLEIRGPGEVLGTRQTGLIQMRIADLQRDRGLLPDVERAATVILSDYPHTVQPLIKRWLGDGTRYGDV